MNSFLNTFEPLVVILVGLISLIVLALVIFNVPVSKWLKTSIVTILIILLALIWISPQGTYARATSGNPSLNDPLNDINSSSHWTKDTYCKFTDGTYHATIAQQGYLSYCPAYGTNFGNFAYQVQMTILQGDDGCIVFRESETPLTEYYAFCVSYDGSYIFLVKRPSNDGYTILHQGSNSSISSRQYQVNSVTVVAQGAELDMYVNTYLVLMAKDNTSFQGSIGVGALDQTNSTDVIFSNVQAWPL